MKPRTFTLVLIFLLILSVFITGCSSSKNKEIKFDKSINKKKKEELDKAALFASKCSNCHNLDKIEKSGYKIDEWENVLKRMYEYDNGANLTKKDYPLLLDYLKKTYR